LQAAALAASASAAPPSFGLYGLSPTVDLIRVYPNASTVPIGPALPSNLLQAQELSTIDEKAGVLYSILYDDKADKPMFTGISLSTGAVVSSVPVPFAESSFVGVGQLVAWEPTSARLIAGGQLANQSHVIGLVDPKSGAWEQVAMLNSTWLDVLGGAVTYIPPINSLAFQLGTQTSIDVFLLDMATGAITEVDQSYANGANVETMDYDPVSQTVYGLGILPSGSTFERSIVALHPSNKTITVVGPVKAYGIESGGIAAINVGARGLYWVGQKTGASPNDPFYLVCNSLVNASVLSAAELCTSDPTCPWSLEFLNARF
jgi:hypothetical protein